MYNILKSREAIAKKYLEILQEANLTAMLDLFTDDAIIISPLYGEVLVKEFYEKLFSDTQKSILTLDGIFSEVNTQRVSVLFDYHWVLVNGKQVHFKVVDIIEFTDELKIKKLTIIYDTVYSRNAISEIRNV